MNTHSVEKYYKTHSRFLGKNQHFFRQITLFTKEVTKELISRNFLSVIAFYSTFPHYGACGDLDFFREIKLQYNSFIEITSQKFA